MTEYRYRYLVRHESFHCMIISSHQHLLFVYIDIRYMAEPLAGACHLWGRKM